jgi:hypothetical protein
MNKLMTQADINKAIEKIDEVVSKELLAIERAEKQTHTDHPMRHWDRTCPACVGEAEKQPPHREWIGLTEKEMKEIWDGYGSYITLFKKVEIKLKEKNEIHI